MEETRHLFSGLKTRED